jgi:hypothetical protein
MMSATSGGSVQKAWFWNEDTSDWFDVQYNPTNFKFNKKVDWKESDEQGQEAKLEYQKATPAEMSCELVFDTTGDGNDVRTVWVNNLLFLTNANVEPSTGQASSTSKLRPPKVSFIWGSFELIGVITGLDVTYLMFDEWGTPLRAKVAVKMKEWAPEEYAQGGKGMHYGSADVQLVTVGPGQTVSAIALKNGTSIQQICDDNNIDDPLDIEPGMVLAITQA